MKPNQPIFFAFIFALILFGCGGGEKNSSPITQEKIDAYITAYKGLKEKAPDFLNDANSGNVDQQKAGFSEFEGEIKKGGLSYPEFVKLNAKIGAIFSVISAESFMGDMEKMKTEGLGQMSEGMKQIQAQIDNPNVPEEAKKEYRKSLEEMKAAQGTINSEYDKNKGWADAVMNKTKGITNLFVSAEDAEMVKLNKDKIEAAYSGGVIPKNFNVEEGK